MVAARLEMATDQKNANISDGRGEAKLDRRAVVASLFG